MLQIIKFGISKYLYLCMEARFSQIRSHIINSGGCILCEKTTISTICIQREDNSISGIVS